MRKLIIMSFIFCCLLVGCGTQEDSVENENLDKVDNSTNNFNNDSDSMTEEIDTSYLIEISALQFQNMVNSSDTYLFFVGRDTCPACRNFKPVITKFASDKKLKIYYVNSTNFSTDDWNIIDQIAQIEYIPTLIISKDGSVLYNEHGSKSYENLEKIVEQYM